MSEFKLLATAIGSLPHQNVDEALDLLFSSFPNCPLWPQLGKIDRHEDMTVQYIQGLPGIEYDGQKEKYFFNTQSETFYEELEEFFLDYEEIIEEKNYEKLEKYAITTPFSSSIPQFLNRLKAAFAPFAKGHIIGPFTWGTMICDETGKCAFYDDTLREILIKGLTLKALWQVLSIKNASFETTPVIFFDEPTMSQYGTSSFITVQRSDIVCAIKEISEVIKSHGALVGVHCCGKSDWGMIIESGVNILNFDAFFFAKSLTLYSKQIEKFLQGGNNYIAWGIVPTLDVEALISTDILKLEILFDDAIKSLCEKGIDRKLILDHSIFTPSCGAGALSVEQAKCAMELTSTLAKKLREGAKV